MIKSRYKITGRPSKESLNKLIALHEIGHALSSDIGLDELFNLITKSCCDIITGTSGAALFYKEHNRFSLKSSYSKRNDISFRSDISSRSLLLRRALKDKYYLLLKGKDPLSKIFLSTVQRNILCIPLDYRNKLLGILVVVDKKEDRNDMPFSDDDINMLSILANHAVIEIENAYAYNKLEELDIENRRKIIELYLLYEIGIAMQSTIKLDKLLQIILRCITSGGGFGFDRAMLFLLNEKNNSLNGMIGLESAPTKKRNRLWKRFSQKDQSFPDWLTDRAKGSRKGNALNKIIKTIRIPIRRKNGCIFSNVVVSKKEIIIEDAKNHYDVNKNILQQLELDNFSIVPIIAKDNVLGLVVVDNKISGNRIDEGDLKFLSRVAIHAGWAIENARLFNKLMDTNKELIDMQDKLIQSERLASLGKFSAEVAHEIKNPLVSIGGFARRLCDITKETTKERMYADIVLKETERLEKMLKDILDFTSVRKPCMDRCNINCIIHNSISLYKEAIRANNIKIVLDIDKKLKDTNIDRDQISQVVINLLQNAIDSMSDKGGVLTIVTRVSDRFPNGGVMFKIKDTGGGVPLDTLHNIFNPFFTTKKRGVGLGLTIIRKIIDSHGGLLELENKPGIGIEFIINLPPN